MTTPAQAPAFSVALSKPGPVPATALLCLIAQTQTIELPGFNKSRSKMLGAGVRFISLAKTGKNEISSEIAWHYLRTKKVIVVCAILICVAVALSVLVISALNSAHQSASASTKPLAWSAVRSEPSGLRIKSGTVEMVIPVGSRLPNGDPLLAVYPEKQSYSTSTGYTALSHR